MRLANRTAVVTGATAGIGRAIAILFAKEGASVIVAGRNSEGGEETVSLIRKAGGIAEFVRVDVTVPSDVQQLADYSRDRLGGVDVLVNNAGIFPQETPIEAVDEAEWDRVFAVNVKGVFLCTKFLVPVMKQSKRGAIVNIGSMVVYQPGPYCATYSTTKGAVIALSKALAIELAPNIRVNCINPSLTDTAMAQRLSPELRQTIIDTSPLKSLIRPEDIANAALFLASDESAMMTGSAIDVDAGRGSV